MPVVSTLVVDMQANTAEFVKTWDKTIGQVQKGGKTFTDATKAATNFATKGLGDLAGGLAGVDRHLEKMVSGMLKSSNALLRIAGGALLVVGTFKEAFDIGKQLGEFIHESILPKLTGAETDKQALDRMKAEIEEQKKFIEEKRRVASLEADIVKSTTAARTEAAVQLAKMQGDEIAAARLAYEGKIALIDQEKQARIRAGFEATTDFVARERITVAAEAEAQAQRLAASRDFTAELNKIDAERHKTVLANLTAESDLLQKQIEDTIAARKRMHEEGSAAAAALNISGIVNLDKVTEFGRRIEAVTKKFFALREEGVPWRDLAGSLDQATGELRQEFAGLYDSVKNSPAAVDLLDKTWRKFNFGDIRANIDSQRVTFEKQGIALDEINKKIIRQTDLLNWELPNAARAAGEAVRNLETRMYALERATFAANQQLAWQNGAFSGQAEAVAE